MFNVSFREGGIWVAKIIGALILAYLLISSFVYTINERNRGVYLRAGAFVKIVDPGFGLKLPLIDDVVEINLEEHVQTYDKMEAYSNDQQPAFLRISVRYQIVPSNVAELYRTYGTRMAAVDRAISPVVYQQSKIVFGKYTAARATGNERGRLNADIADAVTEAVDHRMLRIVSVAMENIEFSKDYMDNIAARANAEVEVLRIKQNAEREKVTAEITVTKAKAAADSDRQAAQARAEITVTQAKAQADAVRAQAAADAESIRLRGEATAGAIKARGDALRNNPDLIRLTQAEKWDGKLPATMLPGNAVPMLNLQQ